MQFSEFKKQILSDFDKHIGISLSDEKCQKFFDFMNLLVEKNKVMNLTAIDDPKEIIVRHFVDSSILLKIFGKDYFDYKKIVDVGTGAGFPGIPLAILIDEGKFVLTDTLGKRIDFLKSVVEMLGLKNVELVKARAEDFSHDKKYREKFDYSVARGVAKISVLSEYSLPLLVAGGTMLSYKLYDCDDELNDGKTAIKILGGMFHVKHPYDLVPSEPKRCVIEIDKIKTTPMKFPRKAGTPSKDPIK